MARLKVATAKNQNENSRKNPTEYLLFIAINVLLVGISTWQTFVGYKADVAGNALIAFTIALASGIMFLALNFGIRERRMNGESHGLLLLMYIVPLGMSFFGNFNAFYSNQTQKDFTKNAIREYQTHMTQSKNEAITSIENSVDINSFEREYNSKLEQLRIEFNRAPRGWGREAERKWNELIIFFNEEGSQISAGVLGNTSDVTRYNRALASAESEKDNIITSRQDKIKNVVKSINDKFIQVNTKIDTITNAPQPEYNSSLLDDMVDAENYIRSQASSFLNDRDLFSQEALKPHAVAESGTIKHTLQKAFIDWEQPSATYFSLFFSLIIDLAALLYVLVFYQSNRAKSRKYTKPVGPREIS